MCLSRETSGLSHCHICLPWSSLFQMNSLNSVVKKVLFVFYYYWVNFDNNWLQTKPYYLLVGNGFKTLPSSTYIEFSDLLVPLSIWILCVWEMLLYSFKMVRYSWILTRRMKLFLLCFFPGMIQSWRLPPHLFEAAIALVTAQVLNPLFPAESKEM